jgi:hypothetical protein
MVTDGCIPAFILFCLSCFGFGMLLLIRVRVEKYAHLARNRVAFCLLVNAQR